MRLTERVLQLESQVDYLTEVLSELGYKIQTNKTTPTTKLSGASEKSTNSPMDMGAGRSDMSSAVIWNDAEGRKPAAWSKPIQPTTGYNKHSHSRYSGGALDINTLELVEYDIELLTTAVSGVDNLYEWDSSTYNKHCQNFWLALPSIKTAQNTAKENVKKIGTLDIEFDADRKKWVTGGNDINVKTTMLVEYDENGAVAIDSRGHKKKAPLWNVDASKTNVVWDANAACWRMFAVYADN